jgi:hypothetical protein
MQQALDVGLVRQTALLCDLLRRLDVRDRHTKGHRLRCAANHRKALYAALFLGFQKELGDDFRMRVPPLGFLLLGFEGSRDNLDMAIIS